jgi:hypothetical protein
MKAHLYRRKDGRHVIDGAPLVLQDVQADASISIDCNSETATATQQQDRQTCQAGEQTKCVTEWAGQKGAETGIQVFMWTSSMHEQHAGVHKQGRCKCYLYSACRVMVVVVATPLTSASGPLQA